MLIPTLLTVHATKAVAAGATTVAAAFGGVDVTTGSQTLGALGAGAVIMAMVTIAFNALWQQNRAMARRISQLEQELDGIRRARRAAT
ncbi:MAG: hypothetical protein ACKV2O_11150 [Acidimicrobiales bacterium]